MFRSHTIICQSTLRAVLYFTRHEQKQSPFMWSLGLNHIKCEYLILNYANITGVPDKQHLRTSVLLSQAHTVPLSPPPATHNCDLPLPCVRGLDLGSGLLTCWGDLEDKKTKIKKKDESHFKSLQLDEPEHCFPSLRSARFFHSLLTGQRFRVHTG